MTETTFFLLCVQSSTHCVSGGERVVGVSGESVLASESRLAAETVGPGDPKDLCLPGENVCLRRYKVW